MSLVGDNIARATAAGIRAAQLAPFAHCEPPMRNPIRDYLTGLDTDRARELRRELENRWARRDAAMAGTGAIRSSYGSRLPARGTSPPPGPPQAEVPELRAVPLAHLRAGRAGPVRRVDL
jgi:hypothetical protein